MNRRLPHVDGRIEEAALNPDLWTEAFRLLFSRDGDRAEATFYRHPLDGSKGKIAVTILQGADGPNSEAELVTLAGDAPGALAIEFCLDGDLYAIRIKSTQATAALLCRGIQEVKDEIIHSVRVNRALLSAKTCFCGKASLLGAFQNPIFRLTLDGIVTWQNEAAAGENWRQVFSSGEGKPLTLLQAREQAALRSALADIAANPGSPAKIFHSATSEGMPGATLALKAANPCYPFASPWVELFKPAPQVLAVLRPWDSKPNLSLASLRKLYGLTGKEAELAVAMAQGVSLKDYAENANVSFETARWHSKRVMQKMDCAKQQDVTYALLYRDALFSILD